MLLKTDEHPIKNPLWDLATPNEMYENSILSQLALGIDYSEKIVHWNKANKITSKNLWFEVSIINEKSGIDVPDKFAWWRRPWFMDRVFWVYQTPLVTQIDGKTVLFYYLEMFEGVRVLTETLKRTNQNPYGTLEPSIMLPVKCTHIALFNEWKAGYSEHKRERPEVVKSQEVIEKETALQEETDRILANDTFELSPEQAEEYFGALEEEKKADLQ